VERTTGAQEIDHDGVKKTLNSEQNEPVPTSVLASNNQQYMLGHRMMLERSVEPLENEENANFV